MELAFLDWSIIIGLLLLFVIIGLKLKDKASSSLADFFLGGRNFPWYIAGLSMVATTFAADTPLLVTEIIRKDGISGNWVWWSLLISGMLTTFFFARLWRRANVLTELEYLDIRYEGKVAKFLIAFKSIYLGVILNVIVIAWVNFAMISILQAFFGLDYTMSICITGAMMLFAAFYSSLSGLLGVAVTDAIQFTIAMIGTIILSLYVLSNDKVGGIEGIKAQLSPETLNFLPSIGDSTPGMFSLSILTFISYIGIQWWASWFPGAEPGGGGYIAQRIMSTKDEKHAVWSSLFFNIAHYCLRPWPWIIIALGTIILYPEASSLDAGKTFVYTMKDLLPTGMKGLLLAAFISAYLSTISTQLNWGASFITNDFYKRFIFKGIDNDESGKLEHKRLVNVGRIATLIIMAIGISITPLLDSIEPAWKFLIGSGAGLGLVLILRWFWWRINAWSELSATIAPFIIFGSFKLLSIFYFDNETNKFLDNNNIPFYITSIATTIIWLLVTYLTQPDSKEHLTTYFNRVYPMKSWKIKHNGETTILESEQGIQLKYLFISWISSIAMTYGILFLIGKIIFQEWNEVGLLAGISLISFLILRWSMNKSKAF
jgi:solute:Na+ symporter, SSS family